MLELGSGLRARLVQTRSFSHSIFHKKPSKTHKSRYLPFAASRIYATSNTLGGSKTPSRKQVTIRNDDGQAKWRNLTNGEKVARAIQQTFNFGIILAGFAGLVGVGYFLYTEVFAHDSKTRLFNRVVDRIRADPRALELLGTGQKIGAFGEPTANKWSRNRPLAYEKEEIAFGILKTYTANSSGTFTDRSGITHFKMHFNVTGSARSGVAYVHMVTGHGTDWEYRSLTLVVQGQRVELEAMATAELKSKSGFKMLGVQWR